MQFKTAGVGRTGTFIALRNVMRQAEETGKVDFFTTVQKLRQDRINMVQTVDQYIFLHTAAQVAMVCIGTTVALTDANMRIQILETKSKSGQTKMEEEFKSISSLCDEKIEIKTSEENPYNVYENSQSIVNRQKNRVSTILPKDNFRAKLSNNSSGLTDYINAVLVPSFNKQNQQILTQLPLPTTITDFWRLVTQYNVTLVVAFELNSKSTDQTIGDYLPSSENEPATFSTFHIQTEPVTAATFWKQQKILVTVDGNQVQKKEHRLTHITCTTTDLDPGHLLPITEQIRSMNSSAGERRTLYMCRNGAEYSGLVCVLSLLLNRMDNDHHLTVPLVVGAIKAIRPQVIPTLNQYRVLYQVLQMYSESINEYSNIGDSTS